VQKASHASVIFDSAHPYLGDLFRVSNKFFLSKLVYDVQYVRNEQINPGMPTAVARLVHHSVIIELNLESYRLEQSKKPRM
jgi:hypothetical protein